MQDLFYSLIAALLFLIAAVLEGYYATGAWQDCTDIQRRRGQCPVYWPWGAAAVSPGGEVS